MKIKEDHHHHHNGGSNSNSNNNNSNNNNNNEDELNRFIILINTPFSLNRLRSLLYGFNSFRNVIKSCKKCNDKGYHSYTDVFTFCSCQSLQKTVLVGNRYRILKQNGQGELSKSFQAMDTFSSDQRLVNIKIYHQKNYKIGIREIVILKYLKKNNVYHVVQLFDSLLIAPSFVCLITEILDSFTIPILDQLSVERKLKYIAETAIHLLISLSFTHAIGVIHADLKLDNLMLSENGHEVKIIDFSNSLVLSDIGSFDTGDFIQTFYYRAPEVLLGMKPSFPMDLWSVGCLLCELLMRRPLFSIATDNSSLLEAMVQLTRICPSSSSFCTHGLESSLGENSPESLLMETGSDSLYWFKTRLYELLQINDIVFLDFITGLLQPNYHFRLTAEKALCHPFIRRYFPPFPAGYCYTEKKIYIEFDISPEYFELEK